MAKEKNTRERLDLVKKRVLAVATKKGLRGSELADKLNAKHKGENYSGRGIGRALGELVEESKLVKQGSVSRPIYVKK